MYKNKDLPIDVRARDLLSKMTLDEKIGQMNMQINILGFYDSIVENGGVPSEKFKPFGSTSGVTLPVNAEVINTIQDYYVNKTRLGIPVLFAQESLHGAIHPNGTVFPQCAGIAGSFNKKNVRRMAEIIGMEAKSFGISQVYAPTIDIPRDPRWGRTQENYGEDPYLSGEMGSEYVKGIQSNNIVATAKHFIAYGVSENGLNITPAHIGEREIREVMVEPFKKCIDAGILGIMPSYNEIDGIPMHASKKYLRKLLRDELGFEGITSADWDGAKWLYTLHHVAPNRATVGKMALEAGLDIEAPDPFGYTEDFKQAILRGEIDEKLVDEAVLRILTVKFKIGLFDNPYIDTKLIENIHSTEAIELSRKIDEESILLLKNNGILPLDEKKTGKVAVIGNNAKFSTLGNYIRFTKNCISFYEGMVDRLGKERVLYARGCNPITYTDEQIVEAVETAKHADTVFLVIGDCNTIGGGVPGKEKPEDMKDEITVGEGFDVHTLCLTPSQQKLFDSIIELDKPTILVFYGGRPYALKNEVEKVDAFMFCWGGGEQNGVAFANLIFGDKSPSAKLSVSFPQSVGHIPCYYNHKVSARGKYKNPGTPQTPGRDYVTSSPNAWLPFGYGLSYTTIKYSNLNATVLDNSEVSVSVDIENTGNYDIYETVLLYIRTVWCPITPFIKKLRRFEKVDIRKGEKKTVHFKLTRNDFTYIDEDFKTAYTTGEHKIIIEDLTCDIYL